MENMTEEEKAEQEKKFRVSRKALMLTRFAGNFDETQQGKSSKQCSWIKRQTKTSTAESWWNKSKRVW